MILKYDYSMQTEAQIIELLPESVRKTVTAHLIMEREQTELKLNRQHRDWHGRYER